MKNLQTCKKKKKKEHPKKKKPVNLLKEKPVKWKKKISKYGNYKFWRNLYLSLVRFAIFLY